jgi:hypothetical protein
MSVIVYQLTWCSISEELNLHCTVSLYRSIQMKHIFSAENRYMSRVLSSSTRQVNPCWLPLFWPCHLMKCTAVTETCKVWSTPQMVFHKVPRPVLAFLIYCMDFKPMKPWSIPLFHLRVTDWSSYLGNAAFHHKVVTSKSHCPLLRWCISKLGLELIMNSVISV